MVDSLGLVASVGLTRAIRSLLFGVSATDPVTFGVTALFLVALALVALCSGPPRDKGRSHDRIPSRVKPMARKTHLRFWLWLIGMIGVIVPRRLRRDWRQEWEAELRYRETLLAEWDRLNLRRKLDLLWRSTSAFWDALWLQPQRLEDDMFQDLRYGVRMLLKKPGFTMIAIFTLALGIGASTAIFSAVNPILFESPPYPNANRIVMISEGRTEGGRNDGTFGGYRALLERSRSFEALAVTKRWQPTIIGEAQPERLDGSG